MFRGIFHLLSQVAKLRGQRATLPPDYPTAVITKLLKAFNSFNSSSYKQAAFGDLTGSHDLGHRGSTATVITDSVQ